MIDEDTLQDERLREYAERTSRKVAELREADPRLPYMTAYVMAGDHLQAEDREAQLRAGEIDWDRACVMVGSYARLDFALRTQEAGFATRDRLLDELPELWRGSDPDDTDPRFVELWVEAWERNGREAVLDGDPLPPGDRLTVWRGQREGDPIGLAWSTDQSVAEKFARGAWARMPVPDGEVIEMRARRSTILGYLTGRKESEVIIDPSTVERD